MMLNSNNHSVFKLNYHLIMCIKYRHNVITDTMSTRLKDIFEKVSFPYNIALREWEHDENHVHCLIEGHPNSPLSKFINAYKSSSSRLIKKEFPEIRKKLWKEYFWSRSFCLVTVGGAPLEVLKQYIQNQRSGK
jgi:putative transposase